MRVKWWINGSRDIFGFTLEAGNGMHEECGQRSEQRTEGGKLSATEEMVIEWNACLIFFSFCLSSYYADMERKRCIMPEKGDSIMLPANSTIDPNACVVWRRFAK